MKKIFIQAILMIICLNTRAQNTATTSPVCDGTEGEIAYVIESDIFNENNMSFFNY